MSIKIMVVDDEIGVCHTLERFLVMRDYEVLCVTSGEEALQKVRNEMLTLIFLDVKMPGMDGIQTVEKIREINVDVPVIMLTGLDDNDIKQECLAAGANDYMTKPFNLDQIKEILATYNL